MYQFPKQKIKTTNFLISTQRKYLKGDCLYDCFCKSLKKCTFALPNSTQAICIRYHNLFKLVSRLGEKKSASALWSKLTNVVEKVLGLFHYQQ